MIALVLTTCGTVLVVVVAVNQVDPLQAAGEAATSADIANVGMPTHP